MMLYSMERKTYRLKILLKVSIELDNFEGEIQNIPTNEKKVVISRTIERE